jgi:hypothetical protein
MVHSICTVPMEKPENGGLPTHVCDASLFYPHITDLHTHSDIAAIHNCCLVQNPSTLIQESSTPQRYSCCPPTQSTYTTTSASFLSNRASTARLPIIHRSPVLPKMLDQNAEMVVVGVTISVIVIVFVVGLAYVYHRKTRKLRYMRRDLELAAVASRERHVR